MSDSFHDTSPLFNLNYVFEPRWGQSGFEDDNILVISDLSEEIKVPVVFSISKEVVLGRGNSQPTDDLDDEQKSASDDTITTVSTEFRQHLLKAASESEERKDTAEKLKDSSAPTIDLSSLNAHMYGVSRRHALLEKDGRRITVTDLHSTNGTRLNGTALFPMQRRIVRNGDEIQVGNLRLRVTFSKLTSSG